MGIVNLGISPKNEGIMKKYLMRETGKGYYINVLQLLKNSKG